MGHAMAVWCLDVEFQALFLPVALQKNIKFLKSDNICLHFYNSLVNDPSNFGIYERTLPKPF